jgi:hypothetical protein
MRGQDGAVTKIFQQRFSTRQIRESGVECQHMANRSYKWMERLKYIYFFCSLICLSLMAYLMTKYVLFEDTAKNLPLEKELAAGRPSFKAEETENPAKESMDDKGSPDIPSLENGAIPNQRIIVFKDAAALEAFLKRLGKGLNLLGRLDKFNAVHVGFQNERDLLELLDGSEETSFVYPVEIPGFPVGAQDGAVALKNGLLNWLGVTADNSQWGKGIKIAILDTGIADHIAFKNHIERINLVPLPSDPTLLNGHGTAVASLVFSDHPLAPGVAPGASALSVRIADDRGVSDSFLIAQGILAAVDAGAHLINISLGGSGRSSLVDRALAYAKDAGVIIVAAAGNSGTQGVMQPAASPLVIAVGAVDATNQHLAFSTTGSQVALSAPGYGVNVAYPGDAAARVNGTSFSSPIVVGTIAATMSNSGSQTLSGNSAVSTMFQYLNDIGIQGADSLTGSGVPDMWRILNDNTPGIYDAAVTSVAIDRTNQNNGVQVLVQNLGTEKLINAAVSVNINGKITQSNITTLAVGESRVVMIPANTGETLNIESSIRISGNQTDQRPSNDSISQQIKPTK